MKEKLIKKLKSMSLIDKILLGAFLLLIFTGFFNYLRS